MSKQGILYGPSKSDVVKRLPATSLSKGEKAIQILESGLMVKEYEFLRKNFIEIDCFEFSIQEHTDLEIKYDPSTGIYNMNFYVVLEHTGYHIVRHCRGKSRIGIQHRA